MQMLGALFAEFEPEMIERTRSGPQCLPQTRRDHHAITPGLPARDRCDHLSLNLNSRSRSPEYVWEAVVRSSALSSCCSDNPATEDRDRRHARGKPSATSRSEAIPRPLQIVQHLVGKFWGELDLM